MVNERQVDHTTEWQDWATESGKPVEGLNPSIEVGDARSVVVIWGPA